MRRIGAAVPLLLLAACMPSPGGGSSSPQQQLIVACESWRRAKIALAGAINADLVDPTSIAPRVAMADSLCSGPLPTDAAVVSSSLDRLEQTITAAQMAALEHGEAAR